MLRDAGIRMPLAFHGQAIKIMIYSIKIIHHIDCTK